MNSFAHKPVTFGHSEQHVTADNWQGIAKGWTDGDVIREAEFVRVSRPRLSKSPRDLERGPALFLVCITDSGDKPEVTFC